MYSFLSTVYNSSVSEEYGLSADSIKEYLVGHMIVSIDKYHSEMTLDNGAVLELASECLDRIVEYLGEEEDWS